MTKIVYNDCYGGASLSDKAIERYAEIKGITLYKSPDVWGGTDYYLCPVEEYNRIKEEDKLSANHERSNAVYFSGYRLLDNRRDPILIQVVEELGEEANGVCANLKIAELPTGDKYRIDEYDGMERVMLIDDYDWHIA
jgi:hypothetical protein